MKKLFILLFIGILFIIPKMSEAKGVRLFNAEAITGTATATSSVSLYNTSGYFTILAKMVQVDAGTRDIKVEAYIDRKSVV